MPFERSNASEMTGENAVFSWTRSISVQTCCRPFSMTVRSTGSIAIFVSLQPSTCSVEAVHLDEDIAKVVDAAARAGVDDQRCIHLFDDGRPLELRSRREKITAIDVSFNPLAVEIDLAPSSTRLVYVGRDLWAEQRQIDTLTHSNDGRTDVHQHR